MEDRSCVAVIMAGGSGTRFWPLSRTDRPKQYLKLFSSQSLIRATVDRLDSLIPKENIFICSDKAQAKLVREHLPEIKNCIFEPEGRNTAACLMLSLKELLARDFSDDTVMIVLSADAYVEDTKAFLQSARDAISLAAQTNGLVTLGIQPTRPHTAYGYIEAGEPSGNGFTVKRFVEKPDAATAKSFLERGGYFWNCGIFAWTLKALQTAFEKHMGESWRHISGARDVASVYKKLPSTPIDKGVMEKADNVYMVPANFGWTDVGSWSAVYDLLVKEKRGNVCLSGTLKTLESQGCLVHVDSDRKVVLVGVDDLVVVESDGVLLIVPKSQDQKVREASKL